MGEGDNEEEGKGGGRKAWEGMEFPNIYLAITVFISTLFSTSFGCCAIKSGSYLKMNKCSDVR